jgi:hypothetical protein
LKTWLSVTYCLLKFVQGGNRYGSSLAEGFGLDRCRLGG